MGGTRRINESFNAKLQCCVKDVPGTPGDPIPFYHKYCVGIIITHEGYIDSVKQSNLANMPFAEINHVSN